MPDVRNSSAQSSAAKGSSRSALIIVSVLALLGLAYALIRVDVLRARIVEVRLELERSEATQSALLARVTALTETSQNTVSRLNQLQTELGGVSDGVNELRGGAAQAQRQSARNEVLYLLRLANDQLQLGRDIASARNSVSAADNLLRQADDPASDVSGAVRQQITRALQQLQAIPDESAHIDAQLQAAEQQVPTLRLTGILLDNTPATAALPDAGLQRAWAVFKQGLSHLLIINSNDTDANAVLNTDEQQLRRRHLQLLLLKARLAHHLHDQQGYVSALSAAHAWLKQYFDSRDATVAALLTQLQPLSQQNIAPALPDLSASIQTLTRQQQSGTEP